MFDFEKIDIIAQAKILTIIAENASKYLAKDEHKQIAKNALDKCWNWLHEKTTHPNELYALIDSGDDTDITVVQEDCTGDDFMIWDCVVYAIAYVCKAAYKHNNSKYMPQPIEEVDSFIYGLVRDIHRRADCLQEDFPKKIEFFYNDGNQLMREDWL